MAGGDVLDAQAVRVFAEQAELHLGVAQDAWAGRLPPLIRLGKGAADVFLEFGARVDDLERQAHGLGTGARGLRLAGARLEI